MEAARARSAFCRLAAGSAPASGPPGHMPPLPLRTPLKYPRAWPESYQSICIVKELYQAPVILSA